MAWSAEARDAYRAKRAKAKEEAMAAEERNRANSRAAQSSNAENEIVGEPWREGDSLAAPGGEIERFDPPVVAEGGRAPDPVVEEDEEEPHPEPTEFDLFLAGLDTPTREALTEEELFVIYRDAQAKALVEKKASLKKAATDKALTAARIGAGVLPKATAAQLAWQDRMGEVMDYTIDLPTLGDGLVDIGLRIDQKVYLHGHSYPVTRAQYESMREIVYKAQQAEMLFEGRDKRHWLRRQARGSVVSHIG